MSMRLSASEAGGSIAIPTECARQRLPCRCRPLKLHFTLIPTPAVSSQTEASSPSNQPLLISIGMALSQALNTSKRTTTAAAAGLNIIHEASEAGSKDQQTLNEIAVREFLDALSKSSDVAMAVAAIRALTTVIRNSAAQTMMGLSKELEEAAQALQRSATCMHA